MSMAIPQIQHNQIQTPYISPKILFAIPIFLSLFHGFSRSINPIPNHLRLLPSLSRHIQLDWYFYELYFLNCSWVFPSHFHSHENHLTSTLIILSLPMPKQKQKQRTLLSWVPPDIYPELRIWVPRVTWEVIPECKCRGYGRMAGLRRKSILVG